MSVLKVTEGSTWEVEGLQIDPAIDLMTAVTRVPSQAVC